MVGELLNLLFIINFLVQSDQLHHLDFEFISNVELFPLNISELENRTNGTYKSSQNNLAKF